VIVTPAQTTRYLLSCTNASTPTPAQAMVTVTVSKSPKVIEVNPH
jgi:hypothetical protein